MQIGIIGSGSMGSGIAQVAAMAGHEVVVYDQNHEAQQRALVNTQKSLNYLAAIDKLTDAEGVAIMGRIKMVKHLDSLEDCGLIIEAIIENLKIKQTVFQALETIVSATCVLASNTSSLSIAALAAACKYPERVIGIHFFNPANIMKLVEIIPAIQTDHTLASRMSNLIAGWRKIPVIAKDTPGFIVNRIARPFYGEAVRIYEEGIADPATIDWAMTTLGKFRMGPFTLMDFIGNDINYAVTESVYAAFWNEPRYRPNFSQKRLVEAGWLGRKSGKGFYNYADGAAKPTPKTDEKLGQYILDRIVIMLINEAADAYRLGIASEKDIELAMTKGVNYPKGLLQWANEYGISNCVQKMDALFDEYHEERYRCSPILRRMASHDLSFLIQQ